MAPPSQSSTVWGVSSFLALAALASARLRLPSPILGRGQECQGQGRHGERGPVVEGRRQEPADKVRCCWGHG
eukprot:8575311-Alexandrium_andersonii.AAC.1